MANFLLATGGSSAGIITSSAITLLSTELVSLGSSSTATSAIVGSAGIIQQSTFKSAPWASIALYSGGAFTPAAGGNIAGWWLLSHDGGTTFEKSFATSPVARPPDFVIPLANSAYASSDVAFAAGPVQMPWLPAKVVVQNNAGVSLASSATAYTSIFLCPTAIQY